jgi:outer membrane protein assembly factor BamB
MRVGLVLLLTLGGSPDAPGADWPQFRGRNCGGVCQDDKALPAEIGPSRNVVWKIALAPGHSSPIVVGDRVYVTAVRERKLLTIALDRVTGRTLWEVEAPAQKLETVHKIGSHVQATPAADQERVISFFGSCGLFCYDRSGKLLWQRTMGPFQNDFGAGSSPVLAGDWVLLCQDHDQNSFLTALDKRTGQTVWQTDRSEFLRGYCTPIVWEVEGKKQIVIAGTLRVAGYDFDTGRELWTVRGIARTICATPVIGGDGRLYVAGWSAGGDPGEPIEAEPFGAALAAKDRNKDGKLDPRELSSGPISQRFTQVDTDGDGLVTRAEYERFSDLFRLGKNAVLAIRPGGRGDVTDTHVVWTNRKQVPFCASPLYYDGLVFTVKTGGLFAALESGSGKALKYERLSDTGSYYASPVAGDGKVYVLSERGALTVVRASGDWEVLHTADFNEDVYATPALAGGRIYLRTAGHLYCFGAAAISLDPGRRNRE